MNEMVRRLATLLLAEPLIVTDDQAVASALAVIEAMREPTEAMLEAASGSIARWAWPAMIDAALEDDHD